MKWSSIVNIKDKYINVLFSKDKTMRNSSCVKDIMFEMQNTVDSFQGVVSLDDKTYIYF